MNVKELIERLQKLIAKNPEYAERMVLVPSSIEAGYYEACDRAYATMLGDSGYDEVFTETEEETHAVVVVE